MNIRPLRNSDEAETLALKVLQFVLSDEVLQRRFLSITGMAPDDFRDAVRTSDFLGGVLDFLLGNEADLLRFCEEHQENPDQPLRARRLLPGYTIDNQENS